MQEPVLLSRSRESVNRGNWNLWSEPGSGALAPRDQLRRNCREADFWCTRRRVSRARAPRAASRGALLVERPPPALHAVLPSLRGLSVPVLRLRLLPLLPPVLLPPLLRLRLHLPVLLVGAGAGQTAR